MSPIRAALAAAALSLSLAAPAQAGQSLLMLVTSDNAEAQAMALVLGNQALAAGNTVELLLCGPAGDIALATAPEAATKAITPKGMTVRSLLDALLAKGGKANVCAIYLPNRQLAPDALMAGVAVANPQEIAAKLADPAVKVIGI